MGGSDKKKKTKIIGSKEKGQILVVGWYRHVMSGGPGWALWRITIISKKYLTLKYWFSDLSFSLKFDSHLGVFTCRWLYQTLARLFIISNKEYAKFLSGHSRRRHQSRRRVQLAPLRVGGASHATTPGRHRHDGKVSENLRRAQLYLPSQECQGRKGAFYSHKKLDANDIFCFFRFCHGPKWLVRVGTEEKLALSTWREWSREVPTAGDRRVRCHRRVATHLPR